MLVDLGWFDFNLGVPPILPSCPVLSAQFQSAQAELGRQWTTQNQSQPSPVHEHMGCPLYCMHTVLCACSSLGRRQEDQQRFAQHGRCCRRRRLGCLVSDVPCRGDSKSHRGMTEIRHANVTRVLKTQARNVNFGNER